jgi:type III secretion protein L
MADLVFIDNGRIRPAAGTRIIKKEVYATLAQADAVLGAARSKAAEIVAAAQDTFESEKQRGHEEGLECARKEMAQQMTAAALDTERHYRDLKEETVALVMTVVKKVLKEIEPQDLIKAQVEKALETFNGSPRVTLKAHPQVADTLQKQLGAITAACPGIDFIDLQMAPDLSPETLILVSATGILEASLATQLAAIEAAFRQTLQPPN